MMRMKEGTKVLKIFFPWTVKFRNRAQTSLDNSEYETLVQQRQKLIENSEKSQQETKEQLEKIVELQRKSCDQNKEKFTALELQLQETNERMQKQLDGKFS